MKNFWLQISSLRLLAQACLESETPLLAEGEATLETLLEAEPSSPSLFRRYIRLIIQRESSDQRRIVEGELDRRPPPPRLDTLLTLTLCSIRPGYQTPAVDRG